MHALASAVRDYYVKDNISRAESPHSWSSAATTRHKDVAPLATSLASIIPAGRSPLAHSFSAGMADGAFHIARTMSSRERVMPVTSPTEATGLAARVALSARTETVVGWLAPFRGTLPSVLPLAILTQTGLMGDSTTPVDSPRHGVRSSEGESTSSGIAAAVGRPCAYAEAVCS